MSLPIRFLQEADEEYRSAYQYYSDKSEDVAANFEKAIQTRLSWISDEPERYPIRGGLRRCVLTKYPYNIHYRIMASFVQVVAVSHQKRRPGYWLSRLDRS
jgi:plasmid stabilization system protein ParE